MRKYRDGWKQGSVAGVGDRQHHVFFDHLLLDSEILSIGVVGEKNYSRKGGIDIMLPKTTK